MQATLIAMSESQLSLLSGIFPRHVVEHLSATVAKAAAAEKLQQQQQQQVASNANFNLQSTEGMDGKNEGGKFDHLARLHENVRPAYWRWCK